MKVYQVRKANYSNQLYSLNKKYNSISFFRLIAIVFFLVALYYFVQTDENYWGGLAFLSFATFLILMRYHSKLLIQKQLLQALVEVNENEIAYLNREITPFEQGFEFNDFNHPYSYDLDIFGTHSLFQNLNRTATFIGKKTLAERLITILSNDEIEENQAAIAELRDKLDWRQEFLALAKVSQDIQSSYENLLKWSVFNSKPISLLSRIISFVLPALFIGFLVIYLVTFQSVYLTVLSYLFVLNMAFMGLFFKRIQTEIALTADIDKTIHQYSLLLQKIESETFTSNKLKNLQKKLMFEKVQASGHLKELSDLFSKMDTIANLITASFFNGTVLYHFHVLYSLIAWKREHVKAINNWLDAIGEFEMLNSLANFSFNNPDFAYPKLNTHFEISFTELSHPLLNPITRVGNDIAFQPQSFLILTGSNMSGKSTFLRSLGINMVLAGIGAPVCASAATIHPLPVLVSMRLSDSLSDSESYFFAEIKRLKQIMDALEDQPAFVLLDEILRGTNSDDKRNGTIEVIKKVIVKKAIGAIATHDIEVCLTTNEYPNTLTNKCFEVEIKEDELHFDYKLRNGICKNKSATFLMKKMGVI